ncbi:cytochrome C [Algoriphagus sp. AK58]|nr:cytochrome C [Algoriphagus sp. AK58]
MSCQAKMERQVTKLNSPDLKEEFYVIPGEDEPLDPESIKKGKVLVSYNDCYHCHREESRAKGPAFTDISKRYPIQKAYVDMLARKIISGGTGTWGYPVMSPHPKISEEDAKLMVYYILSLDQK